MVAVVQAKDIRPYTFAVVSRTRDPKAPDPASAGVIEKPFFFHLTTPEEYET